MIKWIKATDRLPEIEKDVTAKCGENKGSFYCGAEGWKSFSCANTDFGIEMTPENFDMVYWLEETELPSFTLEDKLWEDCDDRHAEQSTHSISKKNLVEYMKQTFNLEI